MGRPPAPPQAVVSPLLVAGDRRQQRRRQQLQPQSRRLPWPMSTLIRAIRRAGGIHASATNQVAGGGDDRFLRRGQADAVDAVRAQEPAGAPATASGGRRACSAPARGFRPRSPCARLRTPVRRPDPAAHYSDSGGGREQAWRCRCRNARRCSAGMSPVRARRCGCRRPGIAAPRQSSRMPCKGGSSRLTWMSFDSASNGDTYSTRWRPAAAARRPSRTSASMPAEEGGERLARAGAARRPASRPPTIASHAACCASVGARNGSATGDRRMERLEARDTAAADYRAALAGPA